jgi:hypothetical protein
MSGTGTAQRTTVHAARGVGLAVVVGEVLGGTQTLLKDSHVSACWVSVARERFFYLRVSGFYLLVRCNGGEKDLPRLGEQNPGVWPYFRGLKSCRALV